VVGAAGFEPATPRL